MTTDCKQKDKPCLHGKKIAEFNDNPRYFDSAIVGGARKVGPTPHVTPDLFNFVFSYRWHGKSRRSSLTPLQLSRRSI